MELKEYQSAALEAFMVWHKELDKARQEADDGIEFYTNRNKPVPEDIRNYPKRAWDNLKMAGDVAQSAGEYVNRTDGVGRHIPHVCFKIPTGGGKTLLAAAALERLNRQTGMTLWITPTRAIYDQTRAALWNKEHPYRQTLERASGGRVKLLEKDDPFTASDIANFLCVMLLMLPSTNRRKGKDFLRMFRDSGRYPTLFPDSDDALSDLRLLSEYPDLDQSADGRPVKHSLFNVFKMKRPVVILDEAHKAYGKRRESQEEFAQSVSRLNPSMVIELSATPNRGISNLLVDIDGLALKNEEVIKLPVQVTSFSNDDWHYTLSQAHEELNGLNAEAQSLLHGENRYIRPIAIIRVERTGRDQRDGERIHAEDVRDYLIQSLGVPAADVAIKSSELDELQGKDLLSRFSSIKWIITKSALMEGWDCPFAYLLVMLDNTRSKNALTQLVGRVMRQPEVRRTGRQTLDRCYIYCHNTSVGDAVEQVKLGLESEGLTGLGDMVMSGIHDVSLVTVHRRNPFQGKDIFLPLVLHKDGDEWAELDYRRHILSAIDWSSMDIPDLKASLPIFDRIQSASVDVEEASTVFHPDRKLYIDKTLRLEWFSRYLSDIIPNPWQAARISADMINKLRSTGSSDEDIYDRRAYLAYILREHAADSLDWLAEQIFNLKLERSEIRFNLESKQHNFKMVEEYEISVPMNSGLMTGSDGHSLQLSLFEPVYMHQFDSDFERNFARYLDEQRALHWWHRVAARQGGEYHLRGWKYERIWPDFIAMGRETEGRLRILVFETKGGHLKGTPDTNYKERVFETLQKAYNHSGVMTIQEGPARGTFKLVFSESNFPTALAELNTA